MSTTVHSGTVGDNSLICDTCNKGADTLTLVERKWLCAECRKAWDTENLPVKESPRV